MIITVEEADDSTSLKLTHESKFDAETVRPAVLCKQIHYHRRQLIIFPRASLALVIYINFFS